MPRQHRPAGQHPAIGSPLFEGHSRTKHKRTAKDYRNTILIVAAGVVAAYLTRDTRHVPLLLGCLSVLVATCYWHRGNQAAVRLLVGVVPVVLLLGMTLAQYKGTKAMAADVTAGATNAQTTVSAGMVTSVQDIGARIVDALVGLVKP